MELKGSGIIQFCGLIIFRISIPELSGGHGQKEVPSALGSAYTRDGVRLKTQQSKYNVE